MTTVIDVTREHINRGEAESCGKCPIAVAITEMLAPGYQVTVTEDRIAIWPADYEVREVGEPLFAARTPDVAEEFICVFDAYPEDRHSPFSFAIDIPAIYLGEDSSRA